MPCRCPLPPMHWQIFIFFYLQVQEKDVGRSFSDSPRRTGREQPFPRGWRWWVTTASSNLNITQTEQSEITWRSQFQEEDYWDHKEEVNQSRKSNCDCIWTIVTLLCVDSLSSCTTVQIFNIEKKNHSPSPVHGWWPAEISYETLFIIDGLVFEWLYPYCDWDLCCECGPISQFHRS